MHTPKLFNDHFQNHKRYHIPKAQLVIADIPYNLGNNAYASGPEWYIGGDMELNFIKWYKADYEGCKL
ncbi:site-specific DNA-methyltransferase [Campylobacter lari]|nr:site-specific DNA-methyltransferase (adenine-specific) [Campylobacter lari subsp. lari]SUX07331.1 site-specific DNA-methyltransferase [Campylobacter lari]